MNCNNCKNTNKITDLERKMQAVETDIDKIKGEFDPLKNVERRVFVVETDIKNLKTGQRDIKIGTDKNTESINGLNVAFNTFKTGFLSDMQKFQIKTLEEMKVFLTDNFNLRKWTINLIITVIAVAATGLTTYWVHSGLKFNELKNNDYIINKRLDSLNYALPNNINSIPRYRYIIPVDSTK